MLEREELRTEVSRAKSAQRGMGRGLAAILSVADDGAEAVDELRELPVELIAPNPRQPRKAFDQTALAALAGSIAEEGVLQPVIVRPVPGGRFELIAGERRWRAAQLAGLEAVPALVRAGGKAVSDAAALELALVENMVREDLNPVEEARACAALVEELGLTREEVGRRVGRSRVAVSNLLRLLDLPDDALALLERGELSEGHGRALLLAGDHDARRTLARAAVDEGWSVRVTEDRARRAVHGGDDGPRRGRRAPAGRTGDGAAGTHPDQQAAAAEIGDTLAAALGTEVAVDPDGEGFRVSFAVADPAAAAALARRLSAPARP